MRRKKLKKESKYMSQSKLYEAIKDKVESLSYKEKEVLYNKIGDKIMNNLATEQEIDIFFLLARYFF